MIRHEPSLFSFSGLSCWTLEYTWIGYHLISAINQDMVGILSLVGIDRQNLGGVTFAVINFGQGFMLHVFCSHRLLSVESRWRASRRLA